MSTWIAVAVLLVVGFGFFSSTGSDDSHITYGAALSLLRHGSIATYNGEHLEQSSSLLHVVLTALVAGATRLSVPLVGYLLGVVAAIACLALTGHLATSVAPRAAGAGPLFVATTPSFLYWTFGGLETPIFALAALASVAACAAHLRGPSRSSLACAVLAMLLLALTRPEGGLVMGSVALGLVVVAAARAHGPDAPLSERIGPELALLVAAALAGAMTAGVHLAVGGHVFPIPVYAKVHGLAPRAGLEYLAASSTWRWAWVAVPFAAGLAAIARRARTGRREERGGEQSAALFVLAYLGFIVSTGGDWMSGGRFLAHVAPLLGLVVVAGAAHVAPRRLLGVPLAVALVAGNAWAVLGLMQADTLGRPSWTVAATARAVAERYPDADYAWFELADRAHARDIPVREELRRILPRVAAVDPGGPLILASYQAGFIVYHTIADPHPPLHYLDLCGLTSDELLRCAGPFLTHGRGGADLSYEHLLNPPEDLARRCSVRRPQIIFDLYDGPGMKELLEQSGYTVVFLQRGSIASGSPLAPSPKSAQELIAVDAELAARAGLEPKTVAYDLP